jgi:hypothetical protein
LEALPIATANNKGALQNLVEIPCTPFSFLSNFNQARQLRKATERYMQFWAYIFHGANLYGFKFATLNIHK